MKSEKEKMQNGNLYYANDIEIVRDRRKPKELLSDLNNLRPSLIEEKNNLIKKFLKNIWFTHNMEDPFFLYSGFPIQM